MILEAFGEPAQGQAQFWFGANAKPIKAVMPGS